ncbi:hypothetical protein [Halobacillus salinus]|uniref:hypothetical protein n=1 Tax=Halobacillus salinus TaxID=192814 RepID=UPI001590D15C|nr:hypothetical protein [Halobacillus salinus]
MDKVRMFLVWILALLICFVCSYWLSYEAEFHPNGYEVVAKHPGSISLQTMDIFGLKDQKVKVQFTEEEAWRISKLESDVDSLDSSYLLFFTSVGAFLFSFFTDRLKDEPLKKGEVWVILFTVGLSWLTLQSELSRISEFL